MVGFKRRCPWSYKSQYLSREVSEDGCLWDRVSLTEKDLARFFLFRGICTAVETSEDSSLSMATTYMFLWAYMVNCSAMVCLEGN